MDASEAEVLAVVMAGGVIVLLVGCFYCCDCHT